MKLSKSTLNMSSLSMFIQVSLSLQPNVNNLLWLKVYTGAQLNYHLTTTPPPLPPFRALLWLAFLGRNSIMFSIPCSMLFYVISNTFYVVFSPNNTPYQISSKIYQKHEILQNLLIVRFGWLVKNTCSHFQLILYCFLPSVSQHTKFHI